MQIKAPRLLINRFGVYYFRLKSEGIEKRISLRTKFSYYKNVSEALLEHRRELNIKFDQTSFHSFRVNVITEFHNKDANAAKVIKIVGHEEGSGIKTQAVQ